LGFIYQAIFRDISPLWWSLLWYPLIFVLSWIIVFYTIYEFANKIPGEKLPALNEKGIWKISIAISIITVISWLLIRFPGVTLLSYLFDWIVPVDLSGLNFLLPSSFIQTALAASHPLILALFPLQFTGAILLLAGLIAHTLQKPLQRTALVILILGGFMMAGAQGAYMYYYFNTVPKFYVQNNQDRDNEINLQTYHNDKYRFELRYPPDWTLQTTQLSNGEEEINISANNRNDTGDYWMRLNALSVGRIITPNNIEEWARNYFKGYTFSDQPITTIGGKTAIILLYEGAPQAPASINTVVVLSNNKLLEFNCLVYKYTSDTNGICKDKILASVTFLYDDNTLLKDNCVKELGDSGDLFEIKLCARVNFLDGLLEATTVGDLSKIYTELLDIVKKNWEGDASLNGLINIWREVDENGNEELVFGGHAITKQREWSVNDGNKITQIPVSVEFRYISGSDKFLVLAECISEVCKSSFDRPIELQNLYTINNLLKVTGETNYSHIIFVINQQTGKPLYRIYVPGGYKTFDPITKQIRWQPLAQ